MKKNMMRPFFIHKSCLWLGTDSVQDSYDEKEFGMTTMIYGEMYPPNVHHFADVAEQMYIKGT